MPHEYMNDIDTQDDPEMSQSQKEIVAGLTANQIEEIDKTILSIVEERYRKVAFIVGKTMGRLPTRVDGIPDIYYSQRVEYLVSMNRLEARGNLNNMRYCEVRLKVSPK